MSTAEIIFFLRHRSLSFVGVVGAAAAAAGGSATFKSPGRLFERGRIWGMGETNGGRVCWEGGTKPPKPIALVGS